MMEKAPDLVIDSGTDITDDFVNTSFDIGIAFIKSCVEYIFVNSNWRHYYVSTNLQRTQTWQDYETWYTCRQDKI